MKEEFEVGIQCPNTTHIDIEGSLLDGTANFKVDVSPTQYAYDQGQMNENITANIVLSTVVTRYYEPEEYEQQGYMTPITMSLAEVYGANGLNTIVKQSVS